MNDGNLIAAHPENQNAVKSGYYSRSGRILAPRAQQLSDELMSLPHARQLDRAACDEIGSLVARLEAIDLDLDQRGHLGRNGARSLLDHRGRLSGQLRAWLREVGATPKARADFAARMADVEALQRALGGGQ